ncbi:MAG: hypothetical protein ABI539_09885 [Acidobacteriota bacterium]
MNGKCFEIGTIQAFLDGEVSQQVAEHFTDHVIDCDGCASLLAQAEDENSAVFSVLDRELDTLVPTQRLWNRINESIAVEKHSVPVWQQAVSLLSGIFASPSLVAAGGVVIVLGLFAVLWHPGGEVELSRVVPPVVPSAQKTVTVDVTTTDLNIGQTAAPIKETNYSDNEISSMVSNASYREPRRQPRAEKAEYRMASASVQPAIQYLPGEETYVKTIVGLKENVEGQKDAILTPSTRVAFERDMAVVDDSIKKMRDVVKKNPKNQSARQVLYSSYQDKIDLLNSVAQREELMASIR